MTGFVNKLHNSLKGYQIFIFMYKENYKFPISAVDIFSSGYTPTVYTIFKNLILYIKKSNLHLTVGKTTFGNVFYTRYKLFCKTESISNPHVEEILVSSIDIKTKTIKFKMLVK